MSDRDYLVKFSGSRIDVAGRFFTDDVAAEIKDMVGREVQATAREGKKIVQSLIQTKHGTGFTKRHIVVDSKGKNSLYATVALRREKDMPRRVYGPFHSNGSRNSKAGQPIKGTKAYPAKRVPFIVLSVMETARYGGRHGYKVRVRGGYARDRRVWMKGERRQLAGAKPGVRRKGLFMFRTAERALRIKEPTIREQLVQRISKRYTEA